MAEDNTDTMMAMELDGPAAEVTQPYSRSPRLTKRIIAAGGKQAKEVLSRRLQELTEEQAKAQAHLQSLKKRNADLMSSAEAMKLQVGEQFDGMRRALLADERAALEAVEQERQEAGTRLDELQRAWKRHLGQVQKDIGSTRQALEKSEAAQDCSWDLSCPKKSVAEEDIKMNNDKFQKLIKILGNILDNLKADLHRKTFLLDSLTVQVDKQTCHKQILVGAAGRRLCFSTEARPVLELPLQFEKVYCALGTPGVSAGRRYWEVDVRCCPAWAVGATYKNIERKGQEKAAKLGRNGHSWCVELREGSLSAWHGDRRVVCRGGGVEPPQRVGVLVDHTKGRLAFYDARTVRLLHEFSAALAPVCDRLQPQFSEPLFPAFRFFKADSSQPGPNYMEVCHYGL
uniref:Si:dkey-219e21.4 n=2 Tax=Paramormyrops kingsleyae TaxID=1676925 RepID=A0A3B3T6W2_9TELE